MTVYDSQGHPVDYYGGLAENDDSFQNQDARLIDLRLPTDGTYFVKVDTFFGKVSDTVTLPDTETGSYELLVYGLVGVQPATVATPTVPFSTTDPDMTTTFPADDLYGGIGGVDTVVGGEARRSSARSPPIKADQRFRANRRPGAPGERRTGPGRQRGQYGPTSGYFHRP